MPALFTGRKSYWAEYTVSSQKYGSETVDLYIIVSYAAGRRGKHGIEYLPYIVINSWPHTLRQLREQYRRRGGVETSYRLTDSLRPRTTSRDPGYRLLLFALAALLVNLWVFLNKWAVLAVHRQGGRQIDHKIFTLRCFATFLSRAVEAIYGVVTSVECPKRMSRASPTRGLRFTESLWRSGMVHLHQAA
jgi:putative transposase